MGLFNIFKNKENDAHPFKVNLTEADELNKRGVECLGIDDGQAVIYFQKAIELGSVKAMRNLGICYFKGKGIPCDFSQAIFWHEEAAKRGNVNSMRDVASLYVAGSESVPPDREKAKYWLQKAVDAGDEKARERMQLFGL